MTWLGVAVEDVLHLGVGAPVAVARRKFGRCPQCNCGPNGPHLRAAAVQVLQRAEARDLGQGASEQEEGESPPPLQQRRRTPQAPCKPTAN